MNNYTHMFKVMVRTVEDNDEVVTLPGRKKEVQTVTFSRTIQKAFTNFEEAYAFYEESITDAPFIHVTLCEWRQAANPDYDRWTILFETDRKKARSW